MTKKLNYIDVKNFIKENGCTLLSKEYINNSSKLDISCGCGETFSVSFAKFRDRNKRQCNLCSKKNNKPKNTLNFDYVANFVKTESNCILIDKEYVNNTEKMNFICSCGNEFHTSFAKFKDRNQRQCYECGQKIKNPSFSIDKVIEIIEKEDCKMLSNTYKNARTKILIECSCKEEVFKTTLEIFQRGKNRCDRCTSSISNISKKVEDILRNMGLSYEREFTFDECKLKKKLRFDFFVKMPNKVLLIEVDGQQHFEPVEIFGGEESFREQIKRDRIKNKYCKDNNLELLRLPYYKEDDFYNIIKNKVEAYMTIPSQA